MRAGSKIKSKAEYYEEAKQLYGNGFAKGQFNFAWANAIAKSGNPHVWDKRGPVPQ